MRVNLSAVGAIAFGAACLGAGLLLGGRGEVSTRIVIMDVGQGSAALVQSRGKSMLIDAGPMTDAFDAGERIVAPSLAKNGVKAVDLVLISHPDQDHIGGLGAIMRRFPVGKIVLPAAFRGRSEFATLPSGRTFWLAGSAAAQLGDVNVQIAAPPAPANGRDNDGSLFARVSVGPAAVVFSGDAPIEVEEAMIGRLPSWRAGVLVAGHHGSRTSTGSQWLDAVRPKYLAISAGVNNRYGHPHASVLKAASARGIEVLRTDRLGDLTIIPSRAGVAYIAGKPRRR